MKIRIDAVHEATYIPECMSVQDTQQTMLQVEHLEQLKDYIICVWPLNRNEIL